ncbi:MAG: phosphoglycolate phosphatase [Rhodomicrobiaceae bacterium]|nr:MAG: phosphoglycolate phosphatase, bacterial [Methyloligella sp.]
MSEKTSQKEWPKAVIMDLDGTLIDSAPDIARALNCAFEDEGLSPFTLDEVRFMIGGGVPKLVERAFDARNMTHDEKEQAIIDGVLKHYTEAPVDNTVIYEGVEHVLSTLRARGLKVGLCTNKPQDITEVALGQLNMTAYFDAIVGGTADTKRKPDPETLKMCADQLGVDVDDCLLVGDSGADRGAAEALEMTVFLVEYGYCKTPVSELKPDGVLDKMSDLLKILFPLESFSS